tara:strand:+ start:156 stop:692 length:537 start_codon:yes stop_codon:yes gene_type:complete
MEIMVINRHYIKTPTEIATTHLNITEEYKQRCIQGAYNIGDQQNHKTNVKAIMSSYQVWEETDVYNNLLDIIQDEVNTKFYPNYYERFTLILGSAWTAIYKEDHYAVSHNHLPAQMSFIYYLKSNNNSSPLLFDGCDFQINPHDGLLVVFPSHLFHNVPKHKGEDRICIAGNFHQELK